MLYLLPTDTCYGLAGEFSREDYEAIYELKGRDTTRQLALLVEDFLDMQKYIEISGEQIDFLRNYPHPWSFLGKKKKSCILPEWMESEKYQMLSIRVAKVCLPNYELRITNYEYPLFLTSANRSGESESTTLEAAKKIFPQVEGIDGGVCDRPPSDIFFLDESGEVVYLRRNYTTN